MKEFMPWKKKYELGFKEIDNQHKELLELVDKAYELGNKKPGKKEINELAGDMISFIRVHFGTEEKYFMEFDYDAAEAHIQAHNEIALQVLRFYDKIKAGDNVLPELAQFLKDWFDSHCTNYDKGYVKCFREHGLK